MLEQKLNKIFAQGLKSDTPVLSKHTVPKPASKENAAEVICQAGDGEKLKTICANLQQPALLCKGPSIRPKPTNPQELAS